MSELLPEGAQVAAPTAAGVVVVTLDRAPVNALDLELTQWLEALLPTLEGASAVVLAGRVGCFSAGLDLRALESYGASDRTALFETIDRVARAWYRAPMPVVTAVTGHAIAGGLLLALCGDLRVVTSDPGARFALPAVRLGVRYPEGPWAVFQSELGPAARRRLLVAGQTVNPTDAVGLGLFDECVPAGEVVLRAVTLAEELAALPPDGFREVKLRSRAM